MFEHLAKWLGFFILRLLSWTYRFEILDEHYRSEAQSLHPQKSYLLTFWHEHLLSPLFFFEGQKHSVIVSDSRDGHMIGFQCHRFGYETVHGSQIRDGKDKGGIRALIGLIAAVRRGVPPAITVDGSIGPRRFVKAGVVELARKTRAPILPFSSAASRYWTLKTWDQFKIPKPFAKIVIQLGAPIMVASDLKKEDMPALQQEIADILNEQERKAFAHLNLGHKQEACCSKHS